MIDLIREAFYYLSCHQVEVVAWVIMWAITNILLILWKGLFKIMFKGE